MGDVMLRLYSLVRGDGDVYAEKRRDGVRCHRGCLIIVSQAAGSIAQIDQGISGLPEALQGEEGGPASRPWHGLNYRLSLTPWRPSRRLM